MPRLEFFFDYGSPYSYLANSRLPGLAERTGAELNYRPMLLGGVFKATGNSSPAVEPWSGAKTRRRLRSIRRRNLTVAWQSPQTPSKRTTGRG